MLICDSVTFQAHLDEGTFLLNGSNALFWFGNVVRSSTLVRVDIDIAQNVRASLKEQF